MKAHKYQLKNGLQVVLIPSSKNPVVSIQAWVRTGSADESPKEAGISHFIEHLLFKGTQKFKVGEIASTIEGQGGELNAYTSFDQTVFHVTLPTTSAQTGLDVISQMMGFPLFDSEEIDREREVVIEEIKRGQDSAGRVHSQLMFSFAFPKHTYGRPVIGYDKNIKKVSVSTLKKYFEQRYTPKNMFLVISGDFEITDMKKQIAKYFLALKPFALRKVKRPKEAKAKSKTVIKKTNFKECHMSFSWRVPAVTHKDVPALDVLALVLGQGDSSRLAKRLRLQEPLVLGVGASSYSLIDHGVFSISMALSEDQAGPALVALADELQNFFKESFSVAELNKAITSLSSETIYSLETVDGLSRSFGSMEFYFKKPNAFEQYLKSLQKLKIDDVLKVAKKYLNPKGLVITGLVEKEQASVSKAVTNFKKDFTKMYSEVTKTKATSKKPSNKTKALTKTDKTKNEKRMKWPKVIAGSGVGNSAIETVMLPGGGKLLLKQQNETPTTSVRMAFGGGLFIEPSGQEGLNELLSRTWGGGSKKYSEEALNEAVESMAAGLGTFSGRNTTGVSAEYISVYENQMWDLIQSLVLEPAFNEEIFERERQMLLQQVAMKKDHPSHLCMRAFAENFYAGHPYAKDPAGTTTSLPALTIDQLHAQKKKIFSRENFNIAIVGDIDKAVWKKRIAELVGALPSGTHALNKKNLIEVTEEKRIFQALKKEQAHLLVGMKAYSIDDPKRWTLHVLQSVLAGQGGRLFLELRDKESLAYTVSPVALEGYGVGSFGIYIGCSPEKTTKAEQMIDAELNKLMTTLIPESELKRAIEYLCGRGLIDLQRKTAISSSILFDSIYGNDPAEGLHPDHHYHAVTAEKIQEVARELFTQKRVISLVGPEAAK